MKSLLGSLDKKPYQAFTIEHGIDRIKILVPLAEAKAFEEAFSKHAEANASTAEIMKTVSSFGGHLRPQGKGR